MFVLCCVQKNRLYFKNKRMSVNLFVVLELAL